jgi:hypothetical protein
MGRPCFRYAKDLPPAKGPDMGYMNPLRRSRGGGMVEEGTGAAALDLFQCSLFHLPQTPFKIPFLKAAVRGDAHSQGDTYF